MTSANFFNGYSTDKPSSKVMNPPGGRSNNIFGYADEEETKPRQKIQTQHESKQVLNAVNPSSIVEPSNKANGSNMNKKRTGYNPITGQAYDDDEPKTQNRQVEQKKQPEPVNVQTEQQPPSKPLHTSSKVLQPPGGKSSGLW